MLATEAPVTSANVMIVKYHFDPQHDQHHIYHRILLERALEITRTEYGDYRIEQGVHSSVAKRQAALLSEGDQINVHWAPAGTEIAQSKAFEIPIDFLFNLQGYRICLIHEKTLFNFSSIKSQQDLKNLRIGQGSYWVDRSVYENSGITPVTSPTLDGLFPMLGLQRFDCMALGINEINMLYEQNKAIYNFIKIEPNLLLHYNFPIYFYVSQKFPKLAERIEKGLRNMEYSGELKKLFLQYHSKNLAILNLKSRHLICLKNPYLKAESQCKENDSLQTIFTEF